MSVLNPQSPEQIQNSVLLDAYKTAFENAIRAELRPIAEAAMEECRRRTEAAIDKAATDAAKDMELVLNKHFDHLTRDMVIRINATLKRT